MIFKINFCLSIMLSVAVLASLDVEVNTKHKKLYCTTTVNKHFVIDFYLVIKGG